MPDSLYPTNTGALAKRRKELSPDASAAFEAFSRAVFADGALDAKTKQLSPMSPNAPIVSRAIPRRHCATTRPRPRSWRRSGLRLKCVPVVPLPIRCWRLTKWRRQPQKLEDRRLKSSGLDKVRRLRQRDRSPFPPLSGPRRVSVSPGLPARCPSSESHHSRSG